MNHKAEKWLDKERRNIILMWWTAAVAQVSFITSTMLMMQDICATGAENENKARPAVDVCDSWCVILQRDLELMHRVLLYLWLSSFVCRNRTTENWSLKKKNSLNALWVWNESLKKREKRKENQLECATQWHKCHDQDYGFYFSSHTNRLLCKHTAQESSLISLIANTRKGDCDNKALCFSHRVIHGYYSGKIIFTELQCEHSHRDLKWIHMVQHEGDECGAVLFVAHQSGSPASGDNIQFFRNSSISKAYFVHWSSLMNTVKLKKFPDDS